MRVLQLHNRYREAGGEDSVVRDETRLLRAAGHEVIEHHVSNPSGGLATAGTLVLSPSNPLSARAVKRIVASQHPDVAHIHNTWYSLSPSVVQALKQSGVPVVMTLHNYRLFCANALLFRDGRPCEDCVGTHPWRGVQHRCYRDSFVASALAASTIAVARARRTWSTGVDRFVAPSWFLREKLVAGGIPAETITVKPHGVDDPGARTTPPSSSRSVLFVGRLSQEKGADTLLDAWAARGASRLELVLVGDGPLRERLEARAVEGVRFARSAPNGAVPLRDGDHTAVNASPESALRKRRLNALGAASLVAEVALVGVNSALAQENFRRPPARRFLIRR